MRKFVLLGIGWLLILIVLIISPKLAGRLQPKIIEKEIPIIRWKREIIEKPIYKEIEKIVEVEKKIYRPANIKIFKVTKIDDTTYRVGFNIDYSASITVDAENDYFIFRIHK